jgi:hypothetical protein
MNPEEVNPEEMKIVPTNLISEQELYHRIAGVMGKLYWEAIFKYNHPIKYSLKHILKRFKTP